MKKIFIAVILLIGLVGCSKEETPQDVTFSIDFQIGQGESMTRGATEMYADFYNNFVKTKAVGYSDYSLSFYKGEELIGTFTGKWDATLVTLPEGTYQVKGSSKAPKQELTDKPDDNLQLKTMALSFDEEVTITRSTTTLSLNPTYDCYLIFFAKSLVTSAKIHTVYSNTYDRDVYSPFYEAGDIYYVFIPSKCDAKNIKYTAADGDSGTLTIKPLGFQNGKFYCLDALVSGYQAPSMENGF